MCFKDKREDPAHLACLAPPPPVGLPDVDGVLVGDAMLLGLLVQQVKEVLNSERHRAAGAENHLEQVVHKLLQGALRGGEVQRCGQRRGRWGFRGELGGRKQDNELDHHQSIKRRRCLN